MTKKLKPLHGVAAAVTAAVLLAACGGSDGDDTPAEDPALVPASVTSSVAAWFTFTKALMSSETAEALLMTNITSLPTTDTDEPTTLGQ